MKFVRKLFIVSLFLSLVYSSFGQNAKDKLVKEQEKLENNIKETKALLAKTQSSTQATVNELKLIENQVRYREELLNNYDNQIRGAELKIEQKDQQVILLDAKIKKLKVQYKKLLLYAYKHRSKQGKIMYLFSATTYYEAIKRNFYLKKIKEIQQQQRLIILQHTNMIRTEKKSLLEEKIRKQEVADQKRKEKEQILKDKEKQQETYSKLKGEETKLTEALKLEVRKKAQIEAKIREAIQKEIAEEAARKAAAAKAAAAKKATTTAPKTTTNTPAEKAPETPAEKAEPKFSESVDLALNKGFETNKGRLPLPVASGSITGKFGEQPHAFLKGITTYNNGIDISSPKNAQVRSVFDGEVSSVLNLPGAGKIIIIKHGNYRTVYSNLQEAYVVVGAKVSARQNIGSLLPVDGEKISILHFEIHQVKDGQILKNNPSLWIAQ